MAESSYTISQLEKLTGLGRRTIHFYIKEKLIPPPEGAGSAARYGERHLLRIKLIRKLQELHLRLSGIRDILNSLSLEEMRDLALKAETASFEWDREMLEAWVLPAERFMRVSHPIECYLIPPMPRRRFPPSTSWKRFAVTDGVEIHVRDDLLEKNELAIREWAQLLKEALHEKGGA